MEGGGSRRNSLSNRDLDYPHPFRMNLKGWGKPYVTPSLTATYVTPTLRRAWRRGAPLTPSLTATYVTPTLRRAWRRGAPLTPSLTAT
jgi:hypothetical protein